MRGSRARDGVSRTLSTAEIENELTRIATIRGRDALSKLRDQALEIAEAIDAAREMAALDDLIGAILGTRNVEPATAAARAAHAGLGFDPRRIELFEALHAALLRDPLESRSDQPGSLPTLPFIEAYFSNWIEGTEFELREAEKIVFGRAVPEDRLEDAHDVLGTFDLVNNAAKRQRTPDGPEDLLALLRSHHALMLERRPRVHPGAFKTRANRAGATTFVHPDLVVGTATIDWSDLEAAERMLEQTNAFLTPEAAEERGARLQLPE